MPVSIRIEPGGGTAIISATGDLARNDAEEAALSLWKTPGWSGEAAIWDFSAARFDLASSDIRAIAQFILRSQPSPPPRRVAFVTPRDVDFGMARMFQAFRHDEGTAFRVFRDLGEAAAWVGAGEETAG